MPQSKTESSRSIKFQGRGVCEEPCLSRPPAIPRTTPRQAKKNIQAGGASTRRGPYERIARERLEIGHIRPIAARHSRVMLRCSCYLHGCPCGFYGDPTRECRCTPAIIQRYMSKLSGPLLDRIDLHIEVPAVPYRELREKDGGTPSCEMRLRVEEARALQRQRGFYNAHIPSRSLRKLCELDAAGERTLGAAGALGSLFTRKVFAGGCSAGPVVRTTPGKLRGAFANGVYSKASTTALPPRDPCASGLPRAQNRGLASATRSRSDHPRRRTEPGPTVPPI